MDDATAILTVVRQHLDQDEELLKLLARVMQTLHFDASPSRRTLELDVMSQMIDSYERLGRFDEAGLMKMQRVVVAHQNKIASCEMAEVAA
jgi:predicted urease superfamily metal-dependent hydrolase